jgi:hypothetical protein
MTTISPHFPKRTALRVGYEQYLDDYAIEPVIKAVTACATQPISELESSLIAALLISQLPHLIHSDLIGSYLSALRGEQEVLDCPFALKYPQSVELPVSAKTPQRRYQERQKICLIPVDGDDREWGTIIGYYLAYHHGSWCWRYALWLDSDSTSAKWLKAILAWSTEIEGVMESL